MQVDRAIFTKVVGLFVILVIGITGFAVAADPISRQEAEAWENHVRGRKGWPANFDILAEAKQREARARAVLARDPYSREAMRDLGDALHTQGHMAEHAHDFESALDLHARSIEMFNASGLPTRESFGTGLDHAMEHVFMDIYDSGVIVERSDPIQARKFFDAAYAWVQRTQITRRTAGQTSRFVPRYAALLRRRGQQFRAASGRTVRAIGHFCEVALHSGQDAFQRTFGIDIPYE